MLLWCTFVSEVDWYVNQSNQYPEERQTNPKSKKTKLSKPLENQIKQSNISQLLFSKSYRKPTKTNPSSESQASVVR
jgi:hypothetical protein